VVSFLYRNLGAERAQKRTVHPYHLACIDSHWYLFAHDVNRRAMRTFVLTRLRDLTVTKRPFTIPAKFDAGEHLKGSMSVFKGTEDYEVVVDFDRWAADLVRGWRWHASQDITELPKGQMRMSMRLNSIEEAERWVLGWGIHATVVRPKALAKRMRTTSRHLLDRYENLLTDSQPAAG
jgi:predicted DNA-binding transcriptional regulator YafY